MKASKTETPSFDFNTPIRFSLFDDFNREGFSFPGGTFVNAAVNGPVGGFEIRFRKGDFEIFIPGDGLKNFRFFVPPGICFEDFEVEIVDFRTGKRQRSFIKNPAAA